MSGAAPTRFVLKAYKTEANAISDSNPLKVVSTKAYITNKEQAAGYNFFTHERYYFRIEANDAVSEFYIDWDDGEDNDPKGKANYTKIINEVPNNIGITSHIFTRDKIHFPKIRVKGVNGFYSKFYQASGDTAFKGIETLVVDSSLPNGRNNQYRIESDSTTNERIPIFAPTPKPPVGILKADKKRVFAGITNKYLSGTGGTYDGVTCKLIGSHQGVDGGRSAVKVNVTYYIGGSDQGDLTNTGSGELITTQMTLGATPTITDVLSVVKMELVDLLEASDDATGISTANKLYPGEKLILVVADGSSDYQDDTPSVIGEVSLGNPIVTLDDPRHSVTFDATESFARCPETTIDTYRIWDGDKLTNHGYDENRAIFAASSTNTSDIFGAGSGRDTLVATSGIKTASYAFHPSMTFTDEYHRWLPQQLLAMTQVISSESAAKADTGGANDTIATYKYSYLEHWVDESQSNNYGEDRTGVTDGYSWPSDMTSSGFMAFRGADDEDNWYDLNPFNRLVGEDNQYALFAQTANGLLADADRVYGKQTTLDSTGHEGGYMITARDSKWTKQHFQTKSYGRDTASGPYRAAPITVNTAANKTVDNEWTGVAHAGVRVEIFYTARRDGDTHIIWKPLKYINNTKHPYLNDSTFYTSGSIEWIEPEDWVECDPASIPDRFWPGGDFEGDANSFSYDSDATGNYFDVSNRWNATNKKYGLMWVIHGDGSATSAHNKFGYGPDIFYSFPASNKHSTLINVIDPMHVSLNSHAITQSVSYAHKGRYQIVEDRMGRADIRKIGATGGTIVFGGVDLKDSDGSATRDKFYEYQSRAVPVYLDITHTSGNISRFFGVITDMSEDHPVGKQFGKFGITMQCSHMLTMDSSGIITSDGYVSLGGDLIDEFRYF